MIEINEHQLIESIYADVWVKGAPYTEGMCVTEQLYAQMMGWA